MALPSIFVYIDFIFYLLYFHYIITGKKDQVKCEVWHDKRMKVFLSPFVCQGSKFYFSSLKLLLNIAWVLNRLKISSFLSIIFFGIDPSFLGCLNTISL